MPLPSYEHTLLVPHRQGQPHGSKAYDETITTQRVDEMWGTEMTSTLTLEQGYAAIFVAVDHCSGECIAIHAAKRATRFEALKPIRQGIRQNFGVFGKTVAQGLSLRHDHGSQYVSHHFQQEIKFLAIKSSPAFVRESDGNACAERFIRTLKENVLWIRTFKTVEELRLALVDFKKLFNESWIIEKYGYKTPSQVRKNQLQGLGEAA